MDTTQTISVVCIPWQQVLASSIQYSHTMTAPDFATGYFCFPLCCSMIMSLDNVGESLPYNVMSARPQMNDCGRVAIDKATNWLENRGLITRKSYDFS